MGFCPACIWAMPAMLYKDLLGQIPGIFNTACPVVNMAVYTIRIHVIKPSESCSITTFSTVYDGFNIRIIMAIVQLRCLTCLTNYFMKCYSVAPIPYNI